MLDKDKWDILVKYFAGELAEGQARMIYKKIESDPEMAKMAAAVRKVWLEAGEKVPEVDIENALKKVNYEIDQVEQTGDFIRQSVEEERYSQSSISVYQKRQKSRKIYARFLAVAACLLIAFVAGYYMTSISTNRSDEGARTTILKADQGEIARYTLSDGSFVTLNSGTILKIEDDYSSASREVELEGEAYFEVAHRDETPFIIRTDHSEVEVLGTSFNVKTASEKQLVEVAVLEGRVSFKGSQGRETERVILQKREYGYLDIARGQITTENFAVENYLFWKNGQLAFHEEPLDLVCNQLTRLFSLECEFDDRAIRDLELTANFRYLSTSNTVSVIALSLNLDYSYDDGVVYWKSGNQ